MTLWVIVLIVAVVLGLAAMPAWVRQRETAEEPDRPALPPPVDDTWDEDSAS